VVVVHGDTFSTLLGALIGKLLKVKVAHVEAGLRSFNVFHPFPEELTRLAVFRLADIAFCPGKFASDNMKPYALEVVDTGHNTIVDALDFALTRRTAVTAEYAREQFGVCSIHRFENIFVKKNLLRIVELIEIAAASYKLVFVLHPPTHRRLMQTGLYDRLKNNGRIVLLPRMGYTRFVELLALARFVITDGGSNQEELSYLGVPTLLMRKATEREEGLGSTVVLGRYSEEVMREFVANLERYRSPTRMTEKVSPTRIINDRLAAFSVTQRS
jgi:UDP-N-acetylglucosamine 2-epimerase (non-hydrolysing)